jgi:hypothetical protein
MTIRVRVVSSWPGACEPISSTACGPVLRRRSPQQREACRVPVCARGEVNRHPRAQDGLRRSGSRRHAGTHLRRTSRGSVHHRTSAGLVGRPPAAAHQIDQAICRRPVDHVRIARCRRRWHHGERRSARAGNRQVHDGAAPAGSSEGVAANPSLSRTNEGRSGGGRHRCGTPGWGIARNRDQGVGVSQGCRCQAPPMVAGGASSAFRGRRRGLAISEVRSVSKRPSWLHSSHPSRR